MTTEARHIGMWIGLVHATNLCEKDRRIIELEPRNGDRVARLGGGGCWDVVFGLHTGRILKNCAIRRGWCLTACQVVSLRYANFGDNVRRGKSVPGNEGGDPGTSNKYAREGRMQNFDVIRQLSRKGIFQRPDDLRTSICVGEH